MKSAPRKLGAAVTVVVTLVLAGTAIAGSFDPRPGDKTIGNAGGIKYVKDSAAFDPGNSNYASDAIWCGHEPQATGGGARLRGASASKFIESSLPRDVYLGYGDPDDVPDDSWDASGYGPAGKRLTTFGICARDANLRYVFLDVPDSPTGNRTASVGCGGGGYHAVGGGGLIAPSQSWTNSSHPYDGGDTDKRPDDGWTLRVFDPVGGIGGFVIEAICMRGAHLAYEKKRATGLDAGEAASRRAGCGRGRHVLGGGLRISGPQDEARAASSFPFDGKDRHKVPDDGWKSTGYNLSGGSKALTTFAICLG